MAGHRIVDRWTTNGLKVHTVIPNGNVEEDDEWVLYRLTDDAIELCQEMAGEILANIHSVQIAGKPAVTQVGPRYKTYDEAVIARNKLSLEEQKRTAPFSVRPETH